jgi:hypothetical protein
MVSVLGALGWSGRLPVVGRKVEHGDEATRLEAGQETSVHGGRFLEVVIDQPHDHGTAALAGEIGACRVRFQDRDVRSSGFGNCLTQGLQAFFADLSGVHDAARPNRFRELERQLPASRADVGDGLSSPEIKGGSEPRGITLEFRLLCSLGLTNAGEHRKANEQSPPDPV